MDRPNTTNPDDVLKEAHAAVCWCNVGVVGLDCATLRAKIEASLVSHEALQATFENGVRVGFENGRRQTYIEVRDYHRSGGEVHETWLHKQIRNLGGGGTCDICGGDSDGPPMVNTNLTCYHGRDE